jgi:hypothetical protein
VDWYKVSISGAIAQLSGQTIVDQCNAGDASLCQYVLRNTNTTQNPLGDITQINTYFLNLNKEIYQGVDAELGWRKSLTLLGGGPEAVTVRVFATHYLTVQQLPPELIGTGGVRTRGPTIDNITTTPDAATAILGYRNGDYSVSLLERYTGSRKINRLYEESTVNAPIVTGNTTVDDNSLSAAFTTDLSLGWSPSKFEGLRLYSTITNLLNKEPQISPGTGGRTGFGSGVAGDSIGRRYVAGVQYKF